MDWIFPLFAATIYICTPAGCDKRINWVLTGLFVLIWSFEEIIVQINEKYISHGLEPYLTDGLWYDLTLMSLYLICAIFFFRLGGKIQYKLSLLGAWICIYFAYLGNDGFYYEEFFRSDYYYVEIMIALYIAQLFISTGGLMFALSNKLLGGGHGHPTGDNRPNIRHHNAGNGHS